MRIWTRKSALVQPRTSLGKSDGVLANRSGMRAVGVVSPLSLRLALTALTHVLYRTMELREVLSMKFVDS